jgi:tripartite-type tricarboxylate transporter receptor subunit TctC
LQRARRGELLKEPGVPTARIARFARRMVEQARRSPCHTTAVLFYNTAEDMMNVPRRFALAALGTAAMAAAVPGLAQTAATKQVRIVVPFTAGGSNDVLARVLAQKLGELWGQTVIVENKAGASGNIGAEFVAKSPADGTALLIAANNVMSMNAALYSKMPINPQKDLDSVSLLGTVPVVLVVRANLHVTSVQELIALARSKPGGLSYASAGVGTPQHLSAELFKSMTRTDIVHVPYKGAAPAITDLIGGQVDLLFGAINSLLPHLRSGKLKALAVAGTKRVRALPDVPTVAEAGVPGYESDIWLGLAAPAHTPGDMVERINRDVRKVMALPDVIDKLAEQGIEPLTSSPAEMAKLVASDAARWSKVIKEAGIRAD